VNLAIPSCAISDSAESILGWADSSEADEPRLKLKIAEDFLLQALHHGPRTRKDLDKEAIRKGITRGTLNKARTDLKVKTRKRLDDGLSKWFLPDNP
jgi:hypothetical protein